MSDFKPVSNSDLPRGFRSVRLNLNNDSAENKSNQFNANELIHEVIYDEPCSNFEINRQAQPPPLPTSQPPNSSTVLNDDEQSIAQPFWSLPSQEQEQLQQHLQQHLSRSPTPTLKQNLLNIDNIQKVITDKEPPANAEFLYENDAYKFYYTVPNRNEQRMINFKQNNKENELTSRTVIDFLNF